MRELDFPRVREAPPEVARGLREVDPRALALWWGPTTSHIERPDPQAPWRKKVVTVVRPVWLVGFVDERRALNEAAARRLGRLDAADLAPAKDESPAAYEARCRLFVLRRRLAYLNYQGFRETFFWPATDIDGGAVEAFREYDWLYRHLFDSMVNAELRRLEGDGSNDSDLTERQAAIAEGVRAAMPGIWRHTMRGRRSIVVPSRAA